MKTLRYLLGFSVVCVLVFYSLALAQRGNGPRGQGPGNPAGPGGRPGGPGKPGGPPKGPPPPRPRDNAGLDFASIEMLGGRQVVKALPYAAEAVIESTQVLGDGTRITRKSVTLVARDGEGRLRRERKLDSIGPFTAADAPPTLIVVDDPILGAHFVFDPRDKTARKIRNPPPPPFRGDGDDQRGEFADGNVVSLGKKSIDGLEAEGTRATIVIAEGKIGNDRQIEIVSERWYSPALQLVILSKHSDPRMGETTYRLTNIRRDEPDASLFRVPADYTIKEDRPPPPPGKRRPGMGAGRPPMAPPPDRVGSPF